MCVTPGEPKVFLLFPPQTNLQQEPYMGNNDVAYGPVGHCVPSLSSFDHSWNNICSRKSFCFGACRPRASYLHV